MGPKRPPYFLIDLVMVVALAGILVGMVVGFARIVGIFSSEYVTPRGQAFEAIRTLLLAWAGLVVWLLVWFPMRALRSAPACRDCGRRFFVRKRQVGAALCTFCRQRYLDPGTFRREQLKGGRLIFVFLVIGMMAPMVLGSNLLEARTGWGREVTLAIAALITAAAFITAIIILLFGIALNRRRRLNNPERLLKYARKCAGKAGTLVSAGALTLWYSGTDDPGPMLSAQWDEIWQRFAALFGEAPARLPLRLFSFEKRDAFVAFLYQRASDCANLDGAFLQGTRIAGLSTELVPYRLSDVQGTAGMMAVYDALECFKRLTAPSWLGLGLAYCLGKDQIEGTAGRLNRKLMAALARGELLDARISFDPRPALVAKLFGGWYQNRNFRTMSVMSFRSWSVVDWLCGAASDNDRRERFCAFVRDLRANELWEPIFERHFGYGFVELLERWRESVIERGIGQHEPAPPPIREALLTRAVPTALDSTARYRHRVQAIRSIGTAGYLTGSDALIALLRGGDPVLRDEAIWSLEAISGQVLGDSPDRWTEWWQDAARADMAGTSPNAVLNASGS